jgi:hypothetical protein
MLGTQHGCLDSTRHVAPDQAQFELEYFLTLTEDGLPLFNLTGQCFQDIGLTEWNNIVRKQCPDNTNLAKASFEESPGYQKHRRPTDLSALCCTEA